MEDYVPQDEVLHVNEDDHTQRKRKSFFNKFSKSRPRTLALLLLLLVALPTTLLVAQQTQIFTPRAAETDPAYCSFERWTAVPDWLKGNASLGSEQKRNAPGTENDHWVKPGPVIQKGQEVATYRYNYDGSLEYKVTHGGKLPVSYDPTKDTYRGDFSGQTNAESAWSMFVRRMDDSYFGTYRAELSSNQISLGILMKYEIMRIARDAIHKKTGGFSSPQDANQKIITFEDTRSAEAQSISDMIGFDVTSLIQNKELRKWEAGNDQQRKANMITESTACSQSAVPTVQPTASMPVNCQIKLLSPPSNFETPVGTFTPNICAAHIANRDPGTNRNELDVCGEYWVTAWCNGNQQNATYACRGWSQDGVSSILQYYPNRIFALTTSNNNASVDGGLLAKNIKENGDILGRRMTWNYLMTEVAERKVAFPYGYKDVEGALQAASVAILGKPWGAVKEEERLNNCQRIWNGASAMPTQAVANPVTSLTPVVPRLSPRPATPTPISSGGAVPTPIPTTPITNPTAGANEKIIEGTIGKDSTGRYHSPSAIVHSNKLHVFVIGDGGATSGKPAGDWFNAHHLETADGTTWTGYTNIKGTFLSPIHTNTGQAGELYVMGRGTDSNIYVLETTDGVFTHPLWTTINPSMPFYTSSKVMSQVTFKGSVYTFAVTTDGKLKICKGAQGCSAVGIGPTIPNTPTPTRLLPPPGTG